MLMNKYFGLATSFIALSIFTTTVYADAAAGAPQANPMSQFVILGGFLLIFYFLIWRPQSKRAKAQRDLMNSIQVDDEVITVGGIVGKVTKITEEGFVMLRIAEGIEVMLQKQAIANSIPKKTMKHI
jgi:preprotein translocase subunit YajC